ncbi:MAG TPA: hypothetical protein VGR46_05935 [Candidatus Limnocylindria bacterium]|jgi:hypothetical protein|nr:hypothetical protein [Candidatus Limnocylindria bacterium]
MTTPDSFKALVGKRVILDLTSAADSPIARGKLLGTIDAADGLVLIVEPDEAPGTRRSVHSHHVKNARAV